MIVAVVGLSTGFLVARLPAVTALIVPAVLGLFVLLMLARALSSDTMEARRVTTWTVASLVVHVLAGLVLHEVVPTFFSTDAATYHAGAVELMNNAARGTPIHPLPSGKEGFFHLLATLYRVFGPHPVSGLVANAVMAAALVPVMHDLTRRLFGGEAARYVAPLVVLLPGFLFWTSQLLREAGVLLLVAIAANSVVRLVSRISAGALVTFTIAIALLFTFRGNVALVMAAGALVGLVVGKANLLSGLSTGGSAMLLIVLLVLGSGLGYSGYKISVEADLEQVQAVRSDLSLSGASGFDSEADVSTVGRAISYLPVALTSFFLGPLPWELRNVRQLLAVPDVVTWWLLLPALWRGVAASRHAVGRRALVLIVPALITGAMLGLLIGNYGTLVRERLQVVLLLIPFVCLGLSQRGLRSAASGPGVPRHEGAHRRSTFA